MLVSEAPPGVPEITADATCAQRAAWRPLCQSLDHTDTRPAQLEGRARKASARLVGKTWVGRPSVRPSCQQPNPHATRSRRPSHRHDRPKCPCERLSGRLSIRPFRNTPQTSRPPLDCCRQPGQLPDAEAGKAARLFTCHPHPRTKNAPVPENQCYLKLPHQRFVGQLMPTVRPHESSPSSDDHAHHLDLVSASRHPCTGASRHRASQAVYFASPVCWSGRRRRLGRRGSAKLHAALHVLLDSTMSESFLPQAGGRACCCSNVRQLRAQPPSAKGRTPTEPAVPLLRATCITRCQ